MRFTLYIVALLSLTTLRAQSFSDSTFMDRGAQQSRSELIAYDKEEYLDWHGIQSSRYLSLIEEWSHPSENQYIFESRFTRPFSWLGRQIYMRVRRVSSPYTLSINGEEVAKIHNSASLREFNITKYTREGRNIVTITLDKESIVKGVEGWRGANSAPSIGGAYVMSQPTQMMRDISISTRIVGDNLHSKITLMFKSHALNQRTSTVYYTLLNSEGKIVTFGERDITTSMRGSGEVTFTAIIPTSEGWSAESPNLYTLKVKTQYEGRFLEYHKYSVGLRSVECDKNSGTLKINGKEVELVAKSLPETLSVTDIAQAKGEGYNAIRIGAGGDFESIYEACDKEGIYVIAPMPIDSSTSPKEITKGGNPSNNPQWFGAYIQRIEAGYYSAQIHPSVVAFSLADRSANGYNLYESYLYLKGLGDSRAVVYFDAEGEWNSDKLRITQK